MLYNNTSLKYNPLKLYNLEMDYVSPFEWNDDERCISSIRRLQESPKRLHKGAEDNNEVPLHKLLKQMYIEDNNDYFVPVEYDMQFFLDLVESDYVSDNTSEVSDTFSSSEDDVTSEDASIVDMNGNDDAIKTYFDDEMMFKNVYYI